MEESEMLLGVLSRIKIGLVLTRKKAEDYEIKARYRLLTVKNIEQTGMFNDESFDIFVSNDELHSQYFTNEGDILIRLSYPNTAVYIGEEQSGLLVPSYFAIIKLQNTNFLPEYIAWYLNTDKVKNELVKSQSGTNILSTNKNVLGKIDIPQIPLEKQQIIINIHRLNHRENKLLQQLIQEKKRFYKAISHTIIGSTEGGIQK
jgi:restriction endonuclease S subunit